MENVQSCSMMSLSYHLCKREEVFGECEVLASRIEAHHKRFTFLVDDLKPFTDAFCIGARTMNQVIGSSDQSQNCILDLLY